MELGWYRPTRWEQIALKDMRPQNVKKEKFKRMQKSGKRGNKCLPKDPRPRWATLIVSRPLWALRWTVVRPEGH